MTPKQKASYRIKRYRSIIENGMNTGMSSKDIAKECALAEVNEIGLTVETLFRTGAEAIVFNENVAGHERR